MKNKIFEYLLKLSLILICFSTLVIFDALVKRDIMSRIYFYFYLGGIICIGIAFLFKSKK